MTDDKLTQQIIGCAYTVHNRLGPGFLEKVYENALRIELEKSGLTVKQQEPISVFYDGQVVGEYYADLFMDNRLIIQLKAVRAVADEREPKIGVKTAFCIRCRFRADTIDKHEKNL